MPPLPPITIKSFQRHIRDRYDATDRARGTPATFLWFMEEVGELATALATEAKKDATAVPAGTDESVASRANLEEEFADVLAWLTTLANINAIDLETAVRRKYLEDDGPEGHK